jgi:hypothetical protein
MLYPKQLLSELGEILLQIDFIGPRYLHDSNEPYHFLSCKYVRPFKCHIFIRIKSQTSKEVLNAFYYLFFVLKLPVPQIVQMDNDAVFRGFIERIGNIGRIIRWLCVNGIIPLFNAPNSPWNNGSVEGGNNVFDKKFWKKFDFQSIAEVDQKLKEFNRAYQTYLIAGKEDLLQKINIPLSDPRKIKGKQCKRFLQPNLYILRVVKEHYGKYQVEALNTYINLPAKFKGQYVLIQIDLIRKWVKIYQEINNSKVLIYENRFYLYL